MKKIIFCLAACAAVMALISCKPRRMCTCCDGYSAIKVPAHNPIDCENYNDVFTVFCNINDYNLYPRNCDTVLVCGYVVSDYNDKVTSPITLIDDYNSYPYRVKICVYDSISDQINSIINASILNKCYIKGMLGRSFIRAFPPICYHYYAPVIFIDNVENIYFKND